MRFSTIATALLAPLCAQAAVMFTNDAYSGITDGVAFTLTWSGDGTAVSILLLTGPTQMLVEVEVVAEHVSGSSYEWTPPGNLAAGIYAFSITQSGSTNYSPQFFVSPNPSSSPSSTAVHAIANPLPSSTAIHAVANPASSSTAVHAVTLKPHRPHPTDTVLSGFNASSIISSTYTRYVNTISAGASASVGASVGVHATASVNCSVPSVSGQPMAVATPVHSSFTESSFTGGAMRLRGFGLGCSVAVVFAGAVVAGWAF